MSFNIQAAHISDILFCVVVRLLTLCHFTLLTLWPSFMSYLLLQHLFCFRHNCRLCRCYSDKEKPGMDK
jgi:hypothetical protein